MTDAAIKTQPAETPGPRGGLGDRVRRTFASLSVRNYRLYFIGQIVSLTGTWMQSVAQALLVLRLAGPNDVGIALGVVTALQFGPVLVLGPYGGVLADRLPKRRVLIITSSVAGVLALALGLLVATDTVQLWMVYALAATLGVLNSIDNPARQTFMHELVGSDQLPNAVMLNSIIVNGSRVVGPAVAGILAATVGLAPSFMLNALSFVAVIVALAMMRVSDLRVTPAVKAARGQLREGFAYAWKTRAVRDALLMMALIGTLTYEFSVSLPLLAHVAFPGSPTEVAASVAALMSAMGVGAVAGGLFTAGRHGASMRSLTIGAFGFGLAMIPVALAPGLAWASIAMGVVGFFSVIFTAYSNAILQITSAPQMRGRVMALWAMAFMGSTVIGAPAVGWVGQVAGPRWALGIGAIAAILAGVLGLDAMRASRARAAAAHQDFTSDETLELVDR